MKIVINVVLVQCIFWIFFIINATGISAYFVYYNWSLIKNDVSCIKFGIRKETKIW